MSTPVQTESSLFSRMRASVDEGKPCPLTVSELSSLIELIDATKNNQDGGHVWPETSKALRALVDYEKDFGLKATNSFDSVLGQLRQEAAHWDELRARGSDVNPETQEINIELSRQDMAKLVNLTRAVAANISGGNTWPQTSEAVRRVVDFARDDISKDLEVEL